MSIFIMKEGKKVLPASFFTKLLIFCCMIGFSAILLQPLQATLNNLMNQIHTELVENLEKITGLKVYYSSIRPAFWGSFDIRSLRFMKDEYPFFTVSRVRFNFSIKDLLLNRKLSIHTVEIVKPVFNIDIQRDKDTLDILASMLNSADSDADSLQKVADFFPQDAVYQIRDGSFLLTENALTCRIDGIEINFNRKPSFPDKEPPARLRSEYGVSNNRDFLFDGRLSFVIQHAQLFDRAISFKSGISINGVLAANLNEGNADIVFSPVLISQLQDGTSAVQKSLLAVLPFSTLLSYKDRIFSLASPFRENYHAGEMINVSGPYNEVSLVPFEYLSNAPHELLGSHYYTSYNISTGVANAEIALNDFRLTDHFTFSNDLDDIKHLLNLQMIGDAYVQYKPSSEDTEENKGGIDYQLNLRGGRLPLPVYSNYGYYLSPLTDAYVIYAAGNEKSATINDFKFSSSALSAKRSFFHGIAGFSGSVNFSPLMVNGKADFDRFNLTGKDEYLAAAFNIASKPNEIFISSDEIILAQSVINDMELHLYPTDKEIEIYFSCLNGGEGEIYLDAVFSLNPGQIEGSVSLDSVSLYDMTEVIRPFMDFVEFPSVTVGYLRDTSISADLFLSTDFNNIVYNVPNLFFNFGEIDGTISLSGTDRQLTLSEGIIDLYENNLYTSAVVNFSDPTDMDFSVNADYLDFAWRMDGHIMDGNTLIISDPNGFNLYGNILNSGAISGYVESINFPIPVNAQTVYLSFYSALRYETHVQWNLDIDHFTAGFNGEDYIMFSGRANQDGTILRNVQYRDTVGVLSGSADISWDMDFSGLAVTANLSDRQHQEIYALECSYKGGKADAYLSVSQIHVNRFFRKNEPMLASGFVKASWDSIDSFTAEVNISSFNTFLQNSPINGAVDIELSNNEIFMHNMNLEYMGLHAYIPQMKVDRSLGLMRTSVDIRETNDNNIAANILLDANFNKVNSWLDIMHAFDKFDGNLILRNIKFHDLTHDEMAFAFSGDSGAFSVSGGIRNMIRLEIDSEGLFFAGLSAPFPVQGTVIGTFINGNLDASCNNIFIDMESIWSLVGNEIEGFAITGGYITGNMDFRGPLTNPEFYGKARATSMRFQVPGYINADLRAVPFALTAEGYDMTFESVVASVGSGSGILNGFFNFENWIPTTIGLDIQIPAGTPIPFNFNIAGFHANGFGSGKMNILLDLFNMVLEISGDIFSNQADLGLSFDEIRLSQDAAMSASAGPSLNTITNFTVTTGTMVEFAWPASSPIIRANPELGSAIYVTSDSQTRQYSLNGEINIRSGELFYFDRSFYIRQGSMNFRENETQFDPRITARAEIRDRAESGDVTISMIVDNQPLRNFEPRFESTPTLTQLEIYSILGQNFSGNQSSDNLELQRFLITSTTDILTQIIATSDVLSQFVFFRQIERTVRNFLGLDMFSVRTRLLQNAVLSGVSGFSQNPVDRNFSVGNYFDNTTVFIGKYIGRDMFIQGMLTMRYDENNKALGGLVFEPDIGIELQSPFVNIRWSFFPYHPENWWVSDNSITLSWRRSY